MKPARMAGKYATIVAAKSTPAHASAFANVSDRRGAAGLRLVLADISSANMAKGAEIYHSDQAKTDPSVQ